MTHQQNRTAQTGSEKTNARIEAITDEMSIATEAHGADATGTCAGGDREGRRRRLAEARTRTLERRQVEMNSRARYERLCARFAPPSQQ